MSFSMRLSSSPTYSRNTSKRASAKKQRQERLTNTLAGHQHAPRSRPFFPVTSSPAAAPLPPATPPHSARPAQPASPPRRQAPAHESPIKKGLDFVYGLVAGLGSRLVMGVGEGEASGSSRGGQGQSGTSPRVQTPAPSRKWTWSGTLPETSIDSDFEVPSSSSPVGSNEDIMDAEDSYGDENMEEDVDEEDVKYEMADLTSSSPFSSSTPGSSTPGPSNQSTKSPICSVCSTYGPHFCRPDDPSYASSLRNSLSSTIFPRWTCRDISVPCPYAPPGQRFKHRTHFSFHRFNSDAKNYGPFIIGKRYPCSVAYLTNARQVCLPAGCTFSVNFLGHFRYFHECGLREEEEQAYMESQRQEALEKERQREMNSKAWEEQEARYKEWFFNEYLCRYDMNKEKRRKMEEERWLKEVVEQRRRAAEAHQERLRKERAKREWEEASVRAMSRAKAEEELRQEEGRRKASGSGTWKSGAQPEPQNHAEARDREETVAQSQPQPETPRTSPRTESQGTPDVEFFASRTAYSYTPNIREHVSSSKPKSSKSTFPTGQRERKSKGPKHSNPDSKAGSSSSSFFSKPQTSSEPQRESTPEELTKDPFLKRYKSCQSSWKSITSLQDLSPLEFSKIPWLTVKKPLGPIEITPEAVKEFMLACHSRNLPPPSSLTASSTPLPYSTNPNKMEMTKKERAAFAKSELKNWHPDKFATRVLVRIQDKSEQERVKKAADVVQRCLTDLLG